MIRCIYKFFRSILKGKQFIEFQGIQCIHRIPRAHGEVTRLPSLSYFTPYLYRISYRYFYHSPLNFFLLCHSTRTFLARIESICFPFPKNESLICYLPQEGWKAQIMQAHSFFLSDNLWVLPRKISRFAFYSARGCKEIFFVTLSARRGTFCVFNSDFYPQAV